MTTMKTTRFALAVLLAGTTSAFAQSALDADGDGLVSLEELRALYADFSDEDFTQLDIDDDGMLNDDEVALGTESGMIPAQN